MKRNKLEKYESKVRSEPSPEQIKQAQNRAVDMIMAVYERMPKDNIKPVKESFSELARQAKFGIVRESTIIVSAESTKNDFTEATKNDFTEATKNETFSDEEKLILESLK
jgi:hypothetical protein